MSNITSRKRVRMSLRHEEADMVPVDFGAMRSTGINILAYKNLLRYLSIKDDEVKLYDIFQQLAEPGREILQRFQGDVVQIHRLKTSFGIKNDSWKKWILPDGSECLVPYGFDPVRNAKNDLEIIDGGKLIARMPAGGFYFDQMIHPYEKVKTREDIDRIPLDVISDEELDFLRAQAAKAYNETDYALLGAFGGNVFEAGQLDWGYERYFMELALDPELIHYYNDRLTENHIRNLNKYLDAIGEYLDVIQFGDDLGTQENTQISPEMYREMIKPYHKAQFDVVHSRYPEVKVFLHSCGSILELIPDLIDAGVEVLNPVQISARKMDPVTLKREFGKYLTFWGGGCSMQTTGTFGSVTDIIREVEELIGIFKPGGGFVFTQVHNIQANIEPEKIAAIYDTAAKFRRY